MMTCRKAVQGSFWVDEEITAISKPAVEFLGMAGRMLYTSKSMRKPTTIFNANIFNNQAKKIWFGDLEIERDREELLKLSLRIGPLYILYESDGRFLERKPSPWLIRSKAIVVVEKGQILCTKDFAERVRILKGRMENG